MNDSWDVTLTQLANGIYDIAYFVVCDIQNEDCPLGEAEFVFQSKYKADVFLHPKYANAKVVYCKPESIDMMRVYIDLDAEVKHVD